jgi:DMSO/TMAO reductase YedYZ molybdopterin-dependent catalytic subunit
VVGIIYAILVESPFSRRSNRHILGTSRPVLLIMSGALIAVWIGFVILLWPVLPANYRGLPYSQARIVSIAALLVWFATFVFTIIGLYRFMVRRPSSAAAEDVDDAGPVMAPANPVPRQALPRRAVLTAAAGGLLTLPIYRLLSRMYDDATFTYDGRAYNGDGVLPITPTSKFYSVTKNVVDPDVDRGIWRLEIAGEVDSPHTYSFADLQDFEQVDQETTLMCISNKIGAGLFSNANWRGVRMRDLLEASGVKDGAVEVLVSGADAYSDTFPVEKAMAEETLVVYEINGEPLPRKHGYPVRVIVPGFYGEKNVKWVTRIEVVTSDAKGFYERQGWGPNFNPRTRSDIFAPNTTRNSKGIFVLRKSLVAGQPVVFKGRAFSPGNGISSVEVSTDEGETWNPANMFYPGTKWTWSQWSFEWTPATTGNHIIIPRCVDGNGVPQDGKVIGIIPQGSSGYQKVQATVV